MKLQADAALVRASTAGSSAAARADSRPETRPVRRANLIDVHAIAQQSSARDSYEHVASLGMDLSGAFSNPFVTDKDLLIRLNDLQHMLLEKAAEALVRPRPRPTPAKRTPVLETVTRVLERAEGPMRACEIHAAACELHGSPLRWPSVKEALSAYTRGGDRRFRRLRRGVYELAHARDRIATHPLSCSGRLREE
jgi:hypothetical protein